MSNIFPLSSPQYPDVNLQKKKIFTDQHTRQVLSKGSHFVTVSLDNGNSPLQKKHCYVRTPLTSYINLKSESELNGIVCISQSQLLSHARPAGLQPFASLFGWYQTRQKWEEWWYLWENSERIKSLLTDKRRTRKKKREILTWGWMGGGATKDWRERGVSQTSHLCKDGLFEADRVLLASLRVPSWQLNYPQDTPRPGLSFEGLEPFTPSAHYCKVILKFAPE